MKTYIKIKIKSLAEEAKMIRQEENKCSNAARKVEHKQGWYAVREGLHNHRKLQVTPECRAALVAYGFLRGRTYNEVEGAAKTEPNWKRVEALVTTYGSRYIPIKKNWLGVKQNLEDPIQLLNYWKEKKDIRLQLK